MATQSYGLPPGTYMFYPATAANIFSNSLVAKCPNSAGGTLTLDTVDKTDPYQKWIITGDGCIMNLGKGNYHASADSGTMTLESASSAQKFLINVTWSPSIYTMTLPGFAGTIRTADLNSYYWLSPSKSGDPVHLTATSAGLTRWAFIPV